MENSWLYCAGCRHKDGSLIEIIGHRQVKLIEDKKLLEQRIDDIFRKYDLEYLKKPHLSIKEFQKPVYEVTEKLYEGSNRGITHTKLSGFQENKKSRT